MFKILSLDGGGIRGVYSAELLRKCESAFCPNGSIANYFDMIAGTSTGGIIALGLSLGMPTSDIVGFYEKDGRKIFPPLPNSWLGQFLRKCRWSLATTLAHEELEAALKRHFHSHLLGAASTRLVIPAFMMPKTEIAVFKTDHHMDFRNDHATPMWKVARATSAAPTYLKGLEHTESGKIFIDGGVWANNPVMVALVDALSAYDITTEQIDILSIGTGNSPFELGRPDVFLGAFAWKAVIKAAMFLTTDNATAQAKLLLGPSRCLRVEPSGVDAQIELDDYDRTFGKLPNLAAKHFEDHKEFIARFFDNVVQPRERHYSG